MVLCCTLNSSKSCKSMAEAMREEIPPGLWSQPPGSGYLATASHNWSTCHSACPACSLHSAPAQHRGSTCHQPRGVSRECRNATHTQVCGVPTKHCRQKTVAESCNGRIELLQKWRITQVSCGISAFPAMGPTISTKSHDTKGSSNHCCVLLTNRNQTGEENNSVGVGSRETKSKPAVILELQWFWPRGQIEVLSKFQLQVKFELNLCLYLLLHVQPTARGIHTPVCAPASRTRGQLHFCSGCWDMAEMSSKRQQGKETLKSRDLAQLWAQDAVISPGIANQ